MGVKFKDIVSPEEISLKDLEGRTVAIDAYNTIYQFLSGIRQRDGSPLMDQNGNVTSHLSGILYRTASIVDKGIKPIYVFDGDSSEHKAKTLEQRRAIKEEAMEKWEEAKKTIKDLIKKYGAEKVLFGTDYPMWSPCQEIEAFLALGLDEFENRCILNMNAKKVFNLEW